MHTAVRMVVLTHINRIIQVSDIDDYVLVASSKSKEVIFGRKHIMDAARNTVRFKCGRDSGVSWDGHIQDHHAITSVRSSLSG